ncbi:MAG TPA: S8 family serine peptidase [Solirubrobacteraceae bacterium]|nr:S8 family serine peptidase [Solirubrobacteraceae bacterium]
MTIDRRHIAGFATVAALAVLAPACAQAAAGAAGGTRLPSSDYGVRGVCPAPAPGHAACMAEQLVPETAQARARTHPLGVARLAARATGPAASGAFGLRPEDLHRAYSLPTAAAEAQTIALVDAYNDLTIEEDLGRFDREFSLPECTAASGCFEKVGQQGAGGSLPFPQSPSSLKAEETACKGGSRLACEEVEEARGWTVEISLDVETAHAVCQSCRIALVEADSDSLGDLGEAERTAEGLGANEISNSWGGPECITEPVHECERDSSIFDDPRTVITASAGDDGYLNWLAEPAVEYANYPASSPHVVAVGGTRLELNGSGEWGAESVWNDGGESAGRKDGHGAGGGGCSVQFEAQPWQQEVADWREVGCGRLRAVADVAADADPYTGVAVEDSSGNLGECEEGNPGNVHWCTIGGTSLASPLIAATFALAGGAHGVEYPARTLYENVARTPSVLHDVQAGSNGECREPFEGALSGEELPTTGCEVSEEAQLSCDSTLICKAGAGYDGPTGLGTPDGIAAFTPAEGESTGNSGGGTAGGGPGGPATGPGAAPAAIPPPPAAAPSPPAPQVSGLALTLKALIALDTSRPKLAKLGFAFRLNVAARVRVSLQKHTTKHHHARWTAVRELAIDAPAGHDVHQLGGHGTLSPGSYRLTLSAEHGSAESISFKIG